MSDITWFGHAAFRLHAAGVHVVIDPFFAPSTGGTADDIDAADLVLVTHDHGDHVGEAVALCRRTGALLGAIVGTAEKLCRAGIPQAQIGNGIGFNMGGTITHKGVSVTMVPAYHSSETGAPAGYIVRMPDGLVVYHAGDTCIYSGMELWGKLYAIDVALLPTGGVFTMDDRQAALACSLLRCRYAIPMHWGTFPALSQGTDGFYQALEALGLGHVALPLRPGATIQVKPATPGMSLPRPA